MFKKDEVSCCNSHMLRTIHPQTDITIKSFFHHTSLYGCFLLNTFILVVASIVKISQHSAEYKNNTACPKMFDSFTSHVSQFEQKNTYTWIGDPFGLLKNTLCIWLLFLLIDWICRCGCVSNKSCWAAAPWETLCQMPVEGITLPFFLLGICTLIIKIKQLFHRSKINGGLHSKEFILSGHTLVYISTGEYSQILLYCQSYIYELLHSFFYFFDHKHN